jgi:hypothetical protein
MKLVEVVGPKHGGEEHLPSKMQTDDSKVESKMMKMRNKMKQYHVRKVIWVLGLMVLLYTLLFCRDSSHLMVSRWILFTLSSSTVPSLL